ncbi:hypothetical protein HYPSUDRAFT_40436 [Hypholoma sublateritium FD-334 SS-4]|uniref:Methyltransferase domain-containing protein n=1 Tax=Hypholoma sublateritium (strain FD-334 SS-4) TaxID=945553 RepID=A0A0D2NVS8_HYPSF|nr:hypothetical protein HYPSUDRAFT_40436 [Hypholoma sublateritium FD-334 SS-4]
MAQNLRYYADPALRPPLNPDLYNLQQDELAFFQKLTGITDETELKSHIIYVQAKAYEIYGYPCIRAFSFTRLKIARVPGYKTALKLLEQRENPILLDIGCCFGNDIRKAVLDGWPVQNVIASDLNPGFWDCGHELFKSTPQSFPAAFIAGDVFDPAFLAPCEPKAIIARNYATPTPTTPLKDLRSLSALQGKASAIFAGAFFHLFNEERQLELAHRLASLLSPEKGSVIFGQHGAMPVKGLRMQGPVIKDEKAPKVQMFCHSPDSWKQMWIDNVFGGVDGKGSERIQVDADLIEVERKDLKDLSLEIADRRFWLLNWCVIRL